MVRSPAISRFPGRGGQGRSVAGACAAGLAALMAAGCVTPEYNYAQDETYGPPARHAGNYTGADRLYRDNFVRNTNPYAAPDQSAPIYEAGYGPCERFVRARPGESLYDVADYCGVPVLTLARLNNFVSNPRHLEAGTILEVPQVHVADWRAAAPGPDGVVFASWYVVQPGDTLNDIAARHLVSASAVANLNPGFAWSALPVGAHLRLPAVGGEGHMPAPTAISGSLPYPYGPASAYAPAPGHGAPAAGDVGVMPYQMTPAQQAAEAEAKLSANLHVDRRVIDRGERVVVSAAGLPANSTVSLYRGPNGREMSFYKTVRTDSEGRFAEEVRVRRDADLGGVIFRAVVDRTGERLQSPRVGVNDFSAATLSADAWGVE